MSSAPEQPDRIEISLTPYDCPECAQTLLDRVYWDVGEGGSCLACMRCGWTDLADDSALRDYEYLQHLYCF